MSENAKWYVVHTYSGYENAVKTNQRPRSFLTTFFSSAMLLNSFPYLVSEWTVCFLQQKVAA